MLRIIIYNSRLPSLDYCNGCCRTIGWVLSCSADASTRDIVWTHSQAGISPPGMTSAGDCDFGAASLLDTRAIERAWFDRWLKGMESSTTEAPLTLFIMGENVWRDEWEWPLARTVWTPFYLHSGGHANSLRDDGTLSADPPGS